MPATIRFIDDFLLDNGEPLAYIYYKQEGWFSLRQILHIFLPEHTEQSVHVSVFSASRLKKSKYYGTKLGQCRIERLRHQPTKTSFRRLNIKVNYVIDIQSTRYLLEAYNPKVEVKKFMRFSDVLLALLKKGGRKRAITTKERMQIAASRGWKCQHCGLDISRSLEFEVDHIHAFSKGGNNHSLNLQVLCLKCHAQKTKKDQQPIFRAIHHDLS